MAWTKVEEIKIRNWTVLVVAGEMTIEEIQEKYRKEVQKRVDAWLETERVKLQAEATEI